MYLEHYETVFKSARIFEKFGLLTDLASYIAICSRHFRCASLVLFFFFTILTTGSSTHLTGPLSGIQVLDVEFEERGEFCTTC